MPRLNMVMDKVFAEIAETPTKKGAYQSLADIDQLLNLPVDPELKKFKKLYLDLAAECSEDIKMLAALEEIIIQMRAKKVVDSEIRLSLSRNYVYARSIFYRRNNKINDIRVVVGIVDELTETQRELIESDKLDDLLKDPEFKEMCKTKVIEAMDKEIERSKLFLEVYVTK